MQHQSSLKLLAYFLQRYPKQSLIVVIALVLAGAAETLGIGALLPLINMIMTGDNHDTNNHLASAISHLFNIIGVDLSLQNLLMTIVITITLKAVIVYQAMRYVGFVAADVARDMRFRLIQALMQAKWEYFVSIPLGKISNTISSEAQRAGHSYMLAGRTAAALIQSLVYIAIAFAVSWKISLLAIAMGIVVAFLLKSFIRMARKAGSNMTSTSNQMLSRLNESLTGIKPLKAMALEGRYIEHLAKDTDAVMNAQKQQYRASLLLQIVHEPLAVILLACGLFYILTYTTTPITLVFLLAFLFYRLISQVNLMQNFYQNMVQNEAAVWGMDQEIQKAEIQREILGTGKTPTLNKAITFSDLTIAYADNQPIFDNFSDTIPAKKLTVLFGPSGIGKTTLIDACLGLINPQKGRICVDELDVNEVDIRQWRKTAAYVPQETFLFHDTIMQNVVLGDDSYTEKDVIAALKAAAAWGFVEEQPDGLNTIVGERGGRLSGGQRQRIALARALIRKPLLLIMDEATTGLDKQSQELVFESIKALSGQVTVVVISHDSAILDLADHIIKLK